MLYLIPTPLGHLQDITLRALDCLKSCDLILCEDTRHSQKLLHHYEIKKPLKSLHKFNEQKQIEFILASLKEGQTIGLISDAGTPCIQDPGALLVKACYKEGLEVIALPGPCAFVMTLSLSGEIEGPFQFLGFFPKKSQALKKSILSALDYEGHSLAYVSPHQLLDVLETLTLLDPTRNLLLTRELTKIYETSYQGTSQELHDIFQKTPPKGEFVLMIKKSLTIDNPCLEMPIEEHILYLETTYHFSKKDAIKLAAQQRGVPKRDLYNLVQKK